MDNNQILTASLLDIVFEGRNKEYGAYSLRRDYNRRLNIAMLSTAAVITVLILFSMIKKGEENYGPVIIPDTTIIDITPPETNAPEIIVPPKPATPPPQQIQSIQFTSPPRIVEDKDVSENDVPPEINDLTNARIDVFSKDGQEGDFGPQPPPGEANGITGGISNYRHNDDSLYIDVQIQSEYPGGTNAWRRFLNKTLLYPQNAVENGTHGTVIVKFIVDGQGTVTNVEAIDGPDELRNEAIRVIKKSGKWRPAIQNGRQVRSYKQQPISFRLGEE